LQRTNVTSPPRSRQSISRIGPDILWSLCVALIAAGIYVATWPVIEIKYGLHTRLPVIGSIWRPPIYMIKDWARVVYYPLHRWKDSHNGNNVAARYWNWWNGILPLTF
jgi:hypothetical protein